MTSQASQLSARRLAPFAVLLVAGILLFFQREDAEHASGLPPLPDPLVHVEPCASEPARATQRAAELEHLAEAAWERAPFDDADVPLSVKAMAEAEACYAVARDREARLRVEARRRLFQSELSVRVQRAQLGMLLAHRAGAAPALARHASALLALSSAAGAQGAVHREALTRVLRTARAEAAQRPKQRG